MNGCCPTKQALADMHTDMDQVYMKEGNGMYCGKAQNTFSEC